ncbi:helix-turn-helix transcriptional regulator [Streptomyces sp. NPDC046924]|uniref:ArsR/SmtB family transcription factor n=1 Tax=Streptomyces sp. NPDC046924 TaxID=3155136 RepID=UPI0033F6ACB1
MPRNPADGTRLQILTWLKEPGHAAHGVTAEAVAARFGMSHPVALTHLRLLTAVGLLRTGQVAGRPHYRRDEVRIAEVAALFEEGWRRTPPRDDHGSAQ